MKKRITILLIFIVSIAISQSNPKILVVPLSFDMVKFDRTVNKMLKYNKVTISDAVRNIDSISVKCLKTFFPEFSIVILSEVDILKYGLSNHEIEQKDKLVERNLEKEHKEKLILLQNYTEFEYIIFFNKFETITKKPFSRKTITKNYFEVYDSEIRKKYTCNSEFSLRISKDMYYSAFLYEFRISVVNVYKTIKRDL